MQINKATQRRKRHLTARQVSLFNHPYVLYDNAPEVKYNTKRGPVIIAGERQTGKTVALMQMAIDLVRNTPHPVRGKRNLIAISVSNEDVDSIWCLLYSLMLTGVPGKQITGPRTSEMLLKQWLKSFKIDVVIGSECALNIEPTNYEVIHRLNDMPEQHGTMWPGTGYFVPGVRCTTIAKYKREQAFSYECSMRFLFASQIVIETSIIGNDKIGHMVRGTLARGQAWPTGHKFTIGFLHKKING